ncbi:MAG TPA: alpha-L-fucosidase, partial [Tepidisphaeraceae bacterium]|nr:alpha-L-fucosidase [Tepidisphaeraceae bacterium]
MKTSVVVFLSLLGMSAFSFGEEPAVHRPFEPTWESLQHHQVPEWYRDGKFGIFVHWGPQALAGAAGSFDGTQSPWKEL